MAKLIPSPLGYVSGKIGNIVFVNSKAYGIHARLPRGTHKKANVNAVLQENSRKAALISQTAKGIHQVLRQCCGAFKQRDLWQMMLKRMFTASSCGIADLAISLNGLEMNSAYRLEKILPGIETKIQFTGETCTVLLKPLCHPLFSPSLQADGYYYTSILLWLDEKGAVCYTESIRSEWIGIDNKIAEVMFYYIKPAEALNYLLLLSVQGGNLQKEIASFKATGMRIIATGAI